MSELPTIRGHRVMLRPFENGEDERLLEILAAPEVAQWWGRYDIARVREEMPGYFAVVINQKVNGLLLVEVESDPDYRHFSLDISLAPGFIGRGLGRDVLRAAIDHYFALGHHRCTIDPAVDNARAIRCYAAVGFRPVGIMRRYERRPNGEWGDNLLMDLIADEYERA